MKKLFTPIVVSVLALTSCGAGGGTVNQSSAEFAKTIEGNSVVVLDVRTPAEFSSGHISGAVNTRISD
jgi:predicted sulfurtransferase